MKKKAMVVGPLFFDYYKDILKEFQKRGYDTLFYSDRPSSNFISNAILRLNYKSQKGKANRYVDRIIKETEGQKIDIALFILGQCFNNDHIRKMKAAHPETKFIFYAWDSIDLFPNMATFGESFDKCYTFDRVEAKQLSYEFLPLYYCEESDPSSGNDFKYNYSSVMTIKKGKMDKYRKIMFLIPSEVKEKSYEFLYIQSKLVYLFYKLTLKEFRGCKMKDFHYKKITRSENYQILKDSRVVLDCPMMKQIGLTMRTIEALHAKKKIITTNKDIVNYDFYSSDNIYVVGEETKSIPIEFFLTPFNEKYTLSEKYSISHFIDTIIGGND